MLNDRIRTTFFQVRCTQHVRRFGTLPVGLTLSSSVRTPRDVWRRASHWRQRAIVDGDRRARGRYLTFELARRGRCEDTRAEEGEEATGAASCTPTYKIQSSFVG